MRTLLCVLFLANWGFAADKRKPAGLIVGQSAPISGVRFLTGEWLKVRAYLCPIAVRSREPKFVVYTRELNESLLALARLIEKEIEADDRLKYSFIEILDPIGGKQQDKETFARMQTATKTAAEKAGVKTLTLGLSRLERAKEAERMGFRDKDDAIVILVAGSRRVKLLERVTWKELTEAKRVALVKKLKTAYENWLATKR